MMYSMCSELCCFTSVHAIYTGLSIVPKATMSLV